MEKLDQKHDTFNLHRNIKEFAEKKIYTTHNITGSEGKLITNQEEKITMWEEYIEQL